MRKLKEAKPILELLGYILEKNTAFGEGPEYITDEVEDPGSFVPKLFCQIGDKENGWGVKQVGNNFQTVFSLKF